MEPYLYWILPLIYISSFVLAIHFIRRLTRVIREAHVLSVPLVEQQNVDFTETGKIILCSKSPPLSMRFFRLGYELTGLTGVPLVGKQRWFGARTSGFSWVRTELWSYDIPMPGSYRLRISGLRLNDKPDEKHKIVFMKPHLGRSLGYVVGIVLAFTLFTVGLVLFIQQFVSLDMGG